MDAKDRPLRDF